MEQISTYSCNALIIGSYGQLGSCLRDEMFNNALRGYATTHDELDFTDPYDIDKFLKTGRYNYVINCAAGTDVPRCEKDEEYALLNNGYSSKLLAEACSKYKVRLIHISTDYVFNGDAIVKFENSDTNPINRYGKSKLLGEQEIQTVAEQSGLEYICIRTSWLYSEFGKNFLKTVIDKIRRKEPISMVYDQVGSPTYARDLAKMIVHIIKYYENPDNEFKSGIYHFSNEGIISWYDFANAILEIYLEQRGPKVRQVYTDYSITPILSSDYDSTVNRPAVGILSKKKIKETFNYTIPYWRDSLKTAITNYWK